MCLQGKTGPDRKAHRQKTCLSAAFGAMACVVVEKRRPACRARRLKEAQTKNGMAQAVKAWAMPLLVS